MIKKILLSPYRFNYHGKYRAIIAVFIFVFVFYFTYFLETHNVYHPEHKFGYFWICTIHALIPTFLFISLTLILEFRFRAKERWRLIWEIGFMAVVLVLVGISNFLVRDIIYDNSENWAFSKFLEEISNTVSIGLLIGGAAVFLGYFLQLKNNVDYADLTNQHYDHPEKSLIEINSQVKKEAFSLHPENLLYAKSDGNYTEIFIVQENKIVRIIKRIPLKDFSEQLASATYILKVHKSFLVNLKAVDEVKGNSAGLKLTLKNLEDINIPVSRKNIPEFEAVQKTFAN